MGKGVILHTDGARSYKLKLPDVIHCNVVLQKKKKIVKGKVTCLHAHNLSFTALKHTIRGRCMYMII